MARIEGMSIKNFKVLKDINFQSLTPMTAVIGKNGVGKSALIDAFGFLSDALKLGVEEACDARGRGGFEKLRTQGQIGPIEFSVFYRERENTQRIAHQVFINTDASNRPYVSREVMMQGDRCFLLLGEGRGLVWRGSEAVSHGDQTAEGFDIFKLPKISSIPEDAEVVEL